MASKNRFVDLDSALLSLKHSRLTQLAKNGVRELPKTVPAGADFLTRIGLNVLERAQSVRDSLMKSVKAKRSSKSKLRKAVTAKAVTPKAKAAKPAKAAKKPAGKTKKK